MILIDGNAIGFAATANRVLRAGERQTQGTFGFIKRIIEMRQMFEGKILVLWDGRSWRYDHYPDYKGNRRLQRVEVVDADDPAAAGLPEYQPPTASLMAQMALKEEWQRQKPATVQLLRAMGVSQMMSPNMEADDLAARLVKARPDEDHMLITGDRDWWQLVGERTSWYCPIDPMGKPPKFRRVTPFNFQEATGYPTIFQFVQSKALMGDTGDNIKGVGGIGPKGAEWILSTFGTVEGFFNESLVSDSSNWAKKYRDFADDPDAFMRFCQNMLMVWLNHPNAPAMIKPKIVTGAPIPQAFEDMCAELAFHSLLPRTDEILGMFQPTPTLTKAA